MSEPRTPPVDDVEQLQQALGHVFADAGLLATALQHASWANERPGVESNERLEFLGDAVLGLVVGHLLYEAHPDWQEGDLTRALHSLVDRDALAECARELRLGELLRLGRSEAASGGTRKDSILADAVEAVVGALFLDAGLEPVRRWARRAYADALAADTPPPERDPKTRFQEWTMERFGCFPSYEVVRDSRVENDDERFRVRVLVGGEAWGEGAGRSKRRAQRLAAETALRRADEAGE